MRPVDPRFRKLPRGISMRTSSSTAAAAITSIAGGLEPVHLVGRNEPAAILLGNAEDALERDDGFIDRPAAVVHLVGAQHHPACGAAAVTRKIDTEGGEPIQDLAHLDGRFFGSCR